ncbi:MAG: hypothetical protein NTV34_07150 [Proteobacteria bacterium]|nr:hypothetical protein [Pseudomonadota bacterium]
MELAFSTVIENRDRFMRFPIIILLLQLTSILPQSVAVAGGMISSGGEFITDEHNPWFVGPSPIRYCVRSNLANFSIANDRLNLIVEQALVDWSATIQKLNPTPLEAPFLDGRTRQLTTSFEHEPCNATTELIFNFGGVDSFLADTLAVMARFTIAFSKPLERDSVLTGRTRGIVWIAGDRGPHAYSGPHFPVLDFWKDENRLYNLLLHELGHVYGFQHLNNGFLAENYPAQLAAFRSDVEPLPGSTRADSEDSDACPRVTSQALVSTKWLDQRQAVCGRASFFRNPISLSRLPNNETAKICLTYDQPLQKFRLNFYLTGALSPETSYLLERTNYSAPSRLYVDLQGKYMTTSSLERDYLPHLFVRLSSDDVGFRFDAAGKRKVALVQTDPSNGIVFNMFDVESGDLSSFVLTISDQRACE